MLVLVVLGMVMALAAAVTAVWWMTVVGDSARAAHGLVHGTARIVEEEMERHGRFAAFVRRRTSPLEVTGLALTLALGALVVFGVLAFQVRSGSVVVDVDGDVSSWAAEHATGTSTDVLRVITDAGATPFVVLFAAAVAGFEVWRRASPGVVLFLLVVVGGQVAATNLVKVIVGRDRPAIAPLVGATGMSFPSGHSASAAACFGACALCLGLGRSRRLHAVMASLAAALAVMVAGSRVLLGVHWLSDTVAGVCFGAAWFALCAVAFGGRLLRFGAPVEAAQRAGRLGSGPLIEPVDRAPGEETTGEQRSNA